MHGGLRCQTDETPDARALYAGVDLEGCDDCLTLAAARGAPAPVLERDDEPAGEITWLVRAALGADAELDVRRKPPLAAPAAVRKRSGNSGPT